MLSKEAKPAVCHTADPSPLPTCSRACVSLRQPLIFQKGVYKANMNNCLLVTKKATEKEGCVKKIAADEVIVVFL